MKKLFLCFMLLLLLAFNLYGQESANVVKLNTIHGGFGVLPPITALSIEYERSINDTFSLGADIGAAFLLWRVHAEVKGRWYPWSKTFFVGLGAGMSHIIDFYSDGFTGMSISPSVGWKINIGKKDKWVFTPNIAYRFLLYDDFFTDEGSAFMAIDVKLSFGVKF